MTQEQKDRHVEILAKEYLKRSASYDPQTIKLHITQGKVAFRADEALTALAMLQEECDTTIRALNEALDQTTKEGLDILRKANEREATIASLREEVERLNIELGTAYMDGFDKANELNDI